MGICMDEVIIVIEYRMPSKHTLKDVENSCFHMKVIYKWCVFHISVYRRVNWE